MRSIAIIAVVFAAGIAAAAAQAVPVLTPQQDGYVICHNDLPPFGDPSAASDSCAKSSLTFSDSKSGTDCEGSKTRTWTATDCNSKTATVSQTFFWKEPCKTLPGYCTRRASLVNGNFNFLNGEMVPTGPLATDTFSFACNTNCRNYKPKNVKWEDVYAALNEIMRCEKRLANFIIRTCFHESGNAQPVGVRGGKGSGANTSGFCSSEHRRIENAGHNFFDHSMGVIAAVANRTGASTMDTMAIACLVAYEATAGDVATESVETLRMGRCDKVSDPEAAQVPADPPGVLPSPFASTEQFLGYWQNQSFTPAEAAALLATHTLLQGKVVNMHHFDLEFINIYAQKWDRLGFKCVRGTNTTSVANLAVANGNSEIAGFTSDLGRLSHVELGITYPPLADALFLENRCVCYDPQYGGNEKKQVGGWPFTQNDCTLWLTCSDILSGNTAGYDAYAQSYCQAFVVFAKYPDLFWGTLSEATIKMVSRGIFSPNSYKPSFSIDYQDIKTANRGGYNSGDYYNPYGRLCNADAKTPCRTTVQGGCNTVATDKALQCTKKGLDQVFHCQVKGVINGKVLVNGKYLNAEDPEAQAFLNSSDSSSSSVSPAVVGGIVAAVCVAVVVVIAAVGVNRYRSRRNQATAEIVTGAAAAEELSWDSNSTAESSF